MGKKIISLMLIFSAVACSSFGCLENEEEIAQKELVKKYTLLETSLPSDLLLVERVKEFRTKPYAERAKFEADQKGKKVQWDVIVRNVEKYTEGIRGATKEYSLVSAKPLVSMDNTFIDIIVPKAVAQALQPDQRLQCTGLVKYITLGGDGHVILFPAKIFSGK
jgi:hypothetical protein